MNSPLFASLLTEPVGVAHYLVVGAVLFVCGALCMATKRNALGVLMGRVWIVGIAILVVGKTADRADGLMAALVALVAFTIYLGTTLILRPSERSTPRT